MYSCVTSLVRRRPLEKALELHPVAWSLICCSPQQHPHLDLLSPLAEGVGDRPAGSLPGVPEAAKGLSSEAASAARRKKALQFSLVELLRGLHLKWKYTYVGHALLLFSVSRYTNLCRLILPLVFVQGASSSLGAALDRPREDEDDSYDPVRPFCQENLFLQLC